jgi:hypothetical protein
MPVEIHVARHGLLHKSRTSGKIFSSSHAPGVTIKDALKSDIDDRMIDEGDIPNAAGNPTVKEYLNLEAGSGFQFQHLDQTYVITQKVT